MNKKIIYLMILLLISGCSLSPGMYMSTKNTSGSEYVFIDSLQRNVMVNEIDENILESIDRAEGEKYRIGNADQIAVTVWGIPEVFPITNINAGSNLRRVDSNGNIYFPYVGIIKAAGKTQDELRKDLTEKLSVSFTNPQLDVSIANFNSQKIYLLGEVTKPSKINITDVPLTLSDALGEVNGLSTNTSSGSQVFIIRQGNADPEIYVADLSSPAAFLAANEFYLKNNDIVYVNANSTTRWNRVISQFFPFSTFINSVDRLLQD